MRKIIINADDCGISSHVNEAIEKSIIAGKITSTTIMANMDDFEGAIRLYKAYCDRVSFGWHINLDEGEPLTSSQLLLDKGFFIEKEGRVLLNGGTYSRKYLSREMREDIKKELRAQWEKLRDSGIDISHADSHHYYHTQPSMVQVMPSLFRELNIKRCRHVANYGISGMSSLIRSAWAVYYRMHGLSMPDNFCFFREYLNNPNLKQGNIIELMVHPGHIGKEYDEEYKTMLGTDYKEKWPSVSFITYREI